VFTLQTLPASDPKEWGDMVDGFLLHAGVAAKAHERNKLERICRYIARSPVAEQRLSLTRNGMVRYELKTPYRDGTTHVLFEPLDFISKLAALVPKPRVNLTRYHGVRPIANIAPWSRLAGEARAGRSRRATILRINHPKKAERR
jgi:hypothetical protein